MGFKLTYMEISNFDFQKAMQKMESAPTDGFTAYRIGKISAALKNARKKITDEYKNEIVEKYAKRDADGKYDENNFVPNEETLADFQQAQDDFGKREIFIDRHPFTIADIKDIKLSSAEMTALGNAFDSSDIESKEARALMKTI